MHAAKDNCPMKILIVTQYFWPENFKINDLAKGLKQRGHDITVLTGKPNYPMGSLYPGYRVQGIQKEYYDTIPVLRAPIIPRGKRSYLRLALNYLSFALSATLVGMFQKLKPDILLVYGPSPITACLPALLLKKQSKAPLLFWVQDLWPESVVSVNALTNKWILTWLRTVVYFIYKHCDFILPSSRAYFSSIKKYKVPENKLRYFPQTAESFYYPRDPMTCSEEEALLPKGFRLLFAGNLGIAQDLPLIIDAAERLKHDATLKWIFLGDGSQRTWLQEEIVKRHLSATVFWLGAYPSEKMPNFLSLSDSLLLSLKRDALFSLTVPGKLQSYLACAKPIVAVLHGEGQRIIEESESGYVTSEQTVKALVDTVIRMKNLSPEARSAMGLKGRQYFEKHFHRDELLSCLEQWMQQLKQHQ